MKNLKISLVILIWIFISSNLSAQNVGFKSAYHFNGNRNDYGRDIAVDDKENIYFCGQFSDSMDFDPGSGENIRLGSNDGFICKLRPNGSLFWVDQLSTTQSSDVFSIVLDSSNNLFALGAATGITKLITENDTIVVKPDINNSVFFVAKFDTSGNLKWIKNFATLTPYFVRSLDIDKNSNIYISGKLYDTLDCDPGEDTFKLFNKSFNDAFIIKLDSSGNFLWANQIYISNPSSFSSFDNSSIEVEPNGNVYFYATYQETIIDTVNHSGSTEGHIYFSKIDSDGNTLWVNIFSSISNSGYSMGQSIVTDNNGNLYVAGILIGTLDFDPGDGITNLTSISGNDVFVSKYDTAGKFIWAKQFGNSQAQPGVFITNDKTGDIYLTGIFTNTADFDPGSNVYNITAKGFNDIYIEKINKEGMFEWVKQIGEDNVGAECSSLAVDITGNIYSTGYFKGYCDFNPGRNSFGFTTENSFFDIFVQKMSPCKPNFAIINEVACNEYISPSGDKIYTNSTIFIDTIPSCISCDSVLAINLTVNKLDTLVNMTDTALICNLTGATYHWVDCSNNYSIIAGETNQIFKPDTSGDFAVILSQNNCIDTTKCYSYIMTGINDSRFINNIKVYPNPTQGEITIKLSCLKDEIMIKVLDITGRELISNNYEYTDFINLNLNTLPGIYFLKIMTKQGEITQFKVLKY